MVGRFGLLLVFTASAFAQSPAPPEFDVASIKLDPAADGPPGMTIEHNGHMAAHRMSLEMLISAAYNVQYYQITQGADWTRTERYEVTAIARTDWPTDSFDWWRPLLRSLLADRFHLVLHRETRQMSVYDLVPAKSGLKIVPTKEGTCTAPDTQAPQQTPTKESGSRLCGTTFLERTTVDAAGITMERLASTLEGVLRQRVINKTDFPGMFDARLEFAPLDASGSPDDSSSAPSIFTVLQEQLGLRLDSVKGPVELLVIDRAERPTAN